MFACVVRIKDVYVLVAETYECVSIVYNAHPLSVCVWQKERFCMCMHIQYCEIGKEEIR